MQALTAFVQPWQVGIFRPTRALQHRLPSRLEAPHPIRRKQSRM